MRGARVKSVYPVLVKFDVDKSAPIFSEQRRNEVNECVEKLKKEPCGGQLVETPIYITSSLMVLYSSSEARAKGKSQLESLPYVAEVSEIFTVEEHVR